MAGKYKVWQEKSAGVGNQAIFFGFKTKKLQNLWLRGSLAALLQLFGCHSELVDVRMETERI
jgi:hypothetical protein